MNESEKLDYLIQEITGMKSDMQDMKSDIKDLQGSVKRIELHLENVTDRNIQLLAEGHLDISRKLSEAIKVSDYQEMLGIRVNVLEEDVRLLKEAVAVGMA